MSSNFYFLSVSVKKRRTLIGKIFFKKIIVDFMHQNWNTQCQFVVLFWVTLMFYKFQDISPPRYDECLIKKKHLIFPKKKVFVWNNSVIFDTTPWRCVTRWMYIISLQDMFQVPVIIIMFGPFGSNIGLLSFVWILTLLLFYVKGYFSLSFYRIDFKPYVTFIRHVLRDLFRIFWITMWINVGTLMYMSEKANEWIVAFQYRGPLSEATQLACTLWAPSTFDQLK